MRTLCLVALAGLAAQPALAVGRLADVTITDRDSGETLTPYVHRGEYWVAGRPGARYAISIRNQSGNRLLAVTSVDGINVLSGQGAAANQRGYVFDPWVGYEIDGWRKSSSEIAAFTFTALPNAYAALTGRPKNIGVIGVALFRERQPDPTSRCFGTGLGRGAQRSRRGTLRRFGRQGLRSPRTLRARRAGTRHRPW